MVNEIKKIVLKAISIPLNVTIKSDFENAIQETYEEFGCFDIIINNAGLIFVKNLEDLEEDSFLNVNIRGTLWNANSL